MKAFLIIILCMPFMASSQSYGGAVPITVTDYTPTLINPYSNTQWQLYDINNSLQDIHHDLQEANNQEELKRIDEEWDARIKTHDANSSTLSNSAMSQALSLEFERQRKERTAMFYKVYAKDLSLPEYDQFIAQMKVPSYQLQTWGRAKNSIYPVAWYYDNYESFQKDFK